MGLDKPGIDEMFGTFEPDRLEKIRSDSIAKIKKRTAGASINPSGIDVKAAGHAMLQRMTKAQEELILKGEIESLKSQTEGWGEFS